MAEWSVIRHAVGMAAAFTCMLRFRRAGQKWTSILKSGDKTVSGWKLLFLSPLLVSFVPWFIVLRFSSAYDQGDVSNYQHVMGLLYAAQTKLRLGFSTYVTTYMIAVAVSKSALNAIVQCKMLVPRSSMLTIYFEALPILNMILQWPLFVFIGTLTGSATIWAFLLFLALRPGLLTRGLPGVPQDPFAPPSGPRAPSPDAVNALKTLPGPPDFGLRDLWLSGSYHPRLRPVAFTLFSPIAQHAKTPVQAHAVVAGGF